MVQSQVCILNCSYKGLFICSQAVPLRRTASPASTMNFADIMPAGNFIPLVTFT